jgi:hypothetical protein
MVQCRPPEAILNPNRKIADPEQAANPNPCWISTRRQTEYAILPLAVINSKCRVGARATALRREVLIQQQIRERQLILPLVLFS